MGGGRCTIETLEDRRLLSATTVLASLRPLAAWPTHDRQPAVEVPLAVGAKKAAKQAAKQDKLAKKADQKQGITPAPIPVDPSAISPSSPTVELTPKEKQLLTIANKSAVDLLGTWSGTFTRNQDRALLNGSITFNVQKKDIATGTFDVSGIAGQSVVSTVTVGKSRDFLAMLKLSGGGQVSLAGAVTSDQKSIIGRWSVQTKAGWTTGIFELKKQA